MTNTPQTCVITGALGFLGRHIAAEFAAAGYRVVGVDRIEAPAGGSDSALSKYVRLDLPGPGIAELLAAEKPGAFVHAAGPASVGDSIANPRADFDGTAGMLFALLDAVRQYAPDARFAILSSAAVYGDPQRLPVAEDAPIAPLSPYGFHKEIAETILREFHAVYSVRTAVARVFSAYGPGLRRQILWDVCEKARAGKVTLFGTGAETRDFVHADDVARGIRAIVESAPMRGEAYNLASGVQTPIRDLAAEVVANIAPGTPIEFSGVVRPGDPLHWEADISAIRALGFTPQVTLAEGVAGYCDWYRDVTG